MLLFDFFIHVFSSTTPQLLMQYGVRVVMQNNLGISLNLDLETFNFYTK